MDKKLIKVAVCDDEQETRVQLLSWMAAITIPANCRLSVTEYSSGAELVDACQSGRAFDLILLDMIMPIMDGIETARAIRGSDDQVLIVYLTSSPDFALQSYHVDAFDYLLKGGDEDRMEPVLQKAIALIAKREERRLQIRSGTALHSVQCSEIEYIEIYAKKLSLHLIGEQVLETYKPIRELESDLAGLTQFFKIHRSIIVNLSFITQIKPTFVITVSGKRLPVARGKHSALERAFLLHAADRI